MATLSHFKFYSVMEHKFQELKKIKLIGQFDDRPNPHQVGSLSHFGIPVSKNNEGIPDEVTHLSWYGLVSTDERLRTVTVTNQFLSNKVFQIGNPEALLVPALKLDIEATLADDAQPPSGVNHFLCYRPNKPFACRATVKLTDQFERNMETPIGALKYFCVPVTKGHEMDPDSSLTPPQLAEKNEKARDHLMLFVIKPKPYGQTRNVFDQFDTNKKMLRKLTNFTSAYLAVPTEKVDWSK